MSDDARQASTGHSDAHLVEPEDSSVDMIGFLQRHLRGFLAVTAVAGLLAAGTYAISLALPPADVVASVDITPTFVGARDGRYPNRAPYSPQDIIANSVVEPVWRSQGLEAAVPLSQLCRNLQVVSGGQEVDLVRSEFLQKLSNTKLTAAERGALEDEFAARMKAMNAASLTITLGGLRNALTPEQMTRLLAALPPEWARLTDAAGGRAYDFPIPLGRELRDSGSRAATAASATAALVHAERLKEFADATRKAVDAMAQLPGSATVRDSAGRSVFDLGQELGSVRRNLVVPAYLDTLAQAKKLDPAGYESIRGSRRRLLESELEASRERVRVLRDAFTSFASDTGSGRRPQEPRGDDPGRSGVIANIDGTFIDRVIEQAVRSRNVEYQRELTDRIVTAELEVVERKQEQDFEKWLEESVLAARTADEAATMSRLTDLTERLAGYSDRAQEIVAVLAARNLNPASVMYRVDLPPTVRAERLIGPKQIATVSVGAWLVGAAAVVVAGSLRDRRRMGGRALALAAGDPQAHVAGSVAALDDRRVAARRLPAGSREPIA